MPLFLSLIAVVSICLMHIFLLLLISGIDYFRLFLHLLTRYILFKRNCKVTPKIYKLRRLSIHLYVLHLLDYDTLQNVHICYYILSSTVLHFTFPLETDSTSFKFETKHETLEFLTTLYNPKQWIYENKFNKPSANKFLCSFHFVWIPSTHMIFRR